MRKPAASLMKRRREFVWVLSLVAIALASPATAQVYKWIDESGATHYSDQAPPSRDTARKVSVVNDRLSVYAPPQPVASSYPGRESALNDRVDALERQLQAERRLRDGVAAADAQAALAAYQRCMAERRIDCDAYAGYPQYAAPLIFAPVRRFRQPVSFTGVDAGNVVPIMPGNFNGPRAITAGNFTTFRPNTVGRRTAGLMSR
jgi:uncharacterized protein DUF4124